MPNELVPAQTYYLNHIGRWYQVVGGTNLANPTANGMPFNLLEGVEYAFYSEESYAEKIRLAMAKDEDVKEKLERLEDNKAYNNFALPTEGIAALKKK